MEKLVLEKLNKIVVPLFGEAFVLCLVSFHVFLSPVLFQGYNQSVKQLDSDQARHYVRPEIMSGQIWVQTVCKSYQQTTPHWPLLRRQKVLSNNCSF